jgi:hypothetical protein
MRGALVHSCLGNNRLVRSSSPPSPTTQSHENKIDTNIDENLFTSLVVGYSELIDDSRVRFRIGEIINRAMSQAAAGRRW